MKFSFDEIAQAYAQLMEQIEAGEDPSAVLKSDALKQLLSKISDQPQDQRAAFGKEVNELKQTIEAKVEAAQQAAAEETLDEIDVTAPFSENAHSSDTALLSTEQGAIHPINRELDRILSIFEAMGFAAVESRQIDDDYHMFGSLNFPEGHPARDDYDTFTTEDGFVAPAHTSTMQNRVLKQYQSNLERGEPIQVVIPGRVYRNEDIDARHEHTFHQVEGVFVDQGTNAGNLIATLKTFLEAYYEQELEVKTQPFYFPFTEPSFEFALSCPFCQKKGCKVCSQEGWIELLGCGMIHPNVLREGGIDAKTYTGFAWGFGVERLVMMKHNVDDIRWFHSGRIDFLEQFS